MPLSPHSTPNAAPPEPPRTLPAGALSARTRWATLAAVLTVGVLLDQITKQIAHAMLPGRGLVTVIEGFFELRYARNPGAFFSLGADLPSTPRRIVFVVLSLAAVALITRLYARATKGQGALRWALLLLLAGALGNLIDRVVFGEVIDFLHLHWRGAFDWATFNVADVLIASGLVLLVLDLLRPQGGATASKESMQDVVLVDGQADAENGPPRLAATELAVAEMDDDAAAPAREGTP